DLSLPFSVEHVAIIPDAPGFILFGRDTNAPDKLRARALYPSCHPAFLGLNSDGDPVQNIADNCPDLSNPKQRDADRNNRGDSCDQDADSDGIPNSKDVQTNGMGQQMQTSLDTDNDGVPNSGDEDDDADDIPDPRDRFPFDTDNDRRPNHRDGDDDDDGYGDQKERDAGAAPLDELDFPKAGVVTFVRRTAGAGGDRTVEVGPLTDLGSATEVLPASHNPHRPRLFDGGNGVVALAGEPGDATEVVSWTKSRGAAVTRATQQTLYDLVPGSTDDKGALTSVMLAGRPTDQSAGWRIGDYNVTSEMFGPQIDDFQTITSFDRAGSTYGVVGGPADCTSCLSLYSLKSNSAKPRVRATPPGRIGRVHFDGARFGFTTTTDDGRRRGYLVSGGRTD
ncbi:MAG: thrombospondin type 3 repeat-containing protein, partial [Bradymonadaceae bacterium]